MGNRRHEGFGHPVFDPVARVGAVQAVDGQCDQFGDAAACPPGRGDHRPQGGVGCGVVDDQCVDAVDHVRRGGRGLRVLRCTFSPRRRNTAALRSGTDLGVVQRLQQAGSGIGRRESASVSVDASTPGESRKTGLVTAHGSGLLVVAGEEPGGVGGWRAPTGSAFPDMVAVVSCRRASSLTAVRSRQGTVDQSTAGVSIRIGLRRGQVESVSPAPMVVGPQVGVGGAVRGAEEAPKVGRARRVEQAGVRPRCRHRSQSLSGSLGKQVGDSPVGGVDQHHGEAAEAGVGVQSPRRTLAATTNRISSAATCGNRRKSTTWAER